MVALILWQGIPAPAHEGTGFLVIGDPAELGFEHDPQVLIAPLIAELAVGELAPVELALDIPTII